MGGSWDQAYGDARAAFQAYLRVWGGERPLILVGHSQGGVMVQRLLREFFQPASALRGRLVAAYTPGVTAVPKYCPIPLDPERPLVMVWNTATDTARPTDVLVSHWGQPNSNIDPTAWAAGKHLGAIG